MLGELASSWSIAVISAASFATKTDPVAWVAGIERCELAASTAFLATAALVLATALLQPGGKPDHSDVGATHPVSNTRKANVKAALLLK
ncbi:hypothetical protein [Rhodococcus sp. BH5]|uniref:hypothetical protein n=1 Tax=Rhodococcus sp. BH5 TaxID=2871702 RepID=UPI0022CD4485|nr:hypothetical protein [Rhodococcus sp. BH5]MCZ9635241.1 hypothetical protein [Rhodococcus sp. BH5]